MFDFCKKSERNSNLNMSKYAGKCDGIHLPFDEKWLRMTSRKETVKKLRKRSEGAEVEKENWRNKTKIKWSHWRTCIIGEGFRAESGAWFLSWTVSGTDRKVKASDYDETKEIEERVRDSRTYSGRRRRRRRQSDALAVETGPAERTAALQVSFFV